MSEQGRLIVKDESVIFDGEVLLICRTNCETDSGAILWEEEDVLAKLNSALAQVAALTEQRDGMLAACKAVDQWLEGEQRVHPDVDGIASLRAQLAAAIAQGEATNG